MSKLDELRRLEQAATEIIKRLEDWCEWAESLAPVKINAIQIQRKEDIQSLISCVKDMPALLRVVDAAKERILCGHDTHCQIMLETRPCSCGHKELQESIRELEGE